MGARLVAGTRHLGFRRIGPDVSEGIPTAADGLWLFQRLDELLDGLEIDAVLSGGAEGSKLDTTRARIGTRCQNGARRMNQNRARGLRRMAAATMEALFPSEPERDKRLGARVVYRELKRAWSAMSHRERRGFGQADATAVARRIFEPTPAREPSAPLTRNQAKARRRARR